jgi:hypothetical protein
MKMSMRPLLGIALAASLGCAAPHQQQVRFPEFFPSSADQLSGTELQALKVVADDLIRWPAVRFGEDKMARCMNGLGAWAFSVFQQDDLVFVRAEFRPRLCGSTEVLVDAAILYAIKDGRIIRQKGEATPD